jgi:hypothetical protein
MAASLPVPEPGGGVPDGAPSGGGLRTGWLATPSLLAPDVGCRLDAAGDGDAPLAGRALRLTRPLVSARARLYIDEASNSGGSLPAQPQPHHAEIWV